MTRYIIYLALILIFSCNSNENSQPNIVLIIGDDHGWPYYGFMGNDIVKTPVLDSLANSGTVFTNGHVTSSICRPSLRTLLTGLYPIQFDNYLDSMKIDFMESNEYQSQIENDFALAEFEHHIIKDFHSLKCLEREVIEALKLENIGKVPMRWVGLMMECLTDLENLCMKITIFFLLWLGAMA